MTRTIRRTNTHTSSRGTSPTDSQATNSHTGDTIQAQRTINNITTATRGTCPGCSRTFRIRNDGNITRHDCNRQPSPENEREVAPTQENAEAEIHPNETPPMASKAKDKKHILQWASEKAKILETLHVALTLMRKSWKMKTYKTFYSSC